MLKHHNDVFSRFEDVALGVINPHILKVNVAGGGLFEQVEAAQKG